MSNPFTYGAEPFQGFTEFDEYESLDEFDEFGQHEFADPETFETNFEFEPEEERGGMRGGSCRGEAAGSCSARSARHRCADSWQTSNCEAGQTRHQTTTRDQTTTRRHTVKTAQTSTQTSWAD